MGEIHELIVRMGREQAKALQSSPEKRALVDIAAAVLEEERRDLGITYSGFALTALPHRRLADDEPWERRGHKVRLLIEPGRLPTATGFKRFGVPYGSRARMILLYLQTRAIQTDCREIELGKTMHNWMDRMGLAIGGKTYKEVREQAARISACNLTFAWDDGASIGFEKDTIVKGGISFSVEDSHQGSLWEERVLLSETFFRELKAHPVPVWEPALRHLQNNSAAIDIYIWLAYRLHSLANSRPVTWLALYDQFGTGYARLRDFRKRFIEALQLAMAVYPEARVDIEDTGLVLHPSRPPIGERKVMNLGGWRA